MFGQGLDQKVRQRHGAPARLGLRIALAGHAAGNLHRHLDHLQLASEQVNIAAPQADTFTPAQPSTGRGGHHCAVAAGECRQDLAHELLAGDRHPGISRPAARR